MHAVFVKTLLFLALTALVGAVPCLGLDNLEPCVELNLAEVAGTFLGERPIAREDLATELLSICCPSAISLGSIGYTLASPQKVALSIYDQQGREVASLVDRTIVSGRHRAMWDGCRKNGQPVKDGTYFLLMKTEKSVKLRRMVLAR